MLVAEEQTEGRGRRGRRWTTQRGAALTFSLRWRFCGPAQALRGLSLATGVALARALHALGAGDVRLKWPNDLLVDGAKLGGILIETRPAGSGIAAIIGVGLNCHSVPGLAERLRRRLAALDELVQPMPRRNELVARLAAELARALPPLRVGGLAAFREEWESLHAFRGQRLRVSIDGGCVISGLADGLAATAGCGCAPRRRAHGLQRQRRRGEGGMILAIDAGNSRVKWGWHDGAPLDQPRHRVADRVRRRQPRHQILSPRRTRIRSGSSSPTWPAKGATSC